MFGFLKTKTTKSTPVQKYEFEQNLMNEWIATLPEGSQWNIGEFQKWRNDKLRELGRSTRWGG